MMKASKRWYIFGIAIIFYLIFQSIVILMNTTSKDNQLTGTFYKTNQIKSDRTVTIDKDYRIIVKGSKVIIYDNSDKKSYKLDKKKEMIVNHEKQYLYSYHSDGSLFISDKSNRDNSFELVKEGSDYYKDILKGEVTY